MAQWNGGSKMRRSRAMPIHGPLLRWHATGKLAAPPTHYSPSSEAEQTAGPRRRRHCCCRHQAACRCGGCAAPCCWLACDWMPAACATRCVEPQAPPTQFTNMVAERCAGRGLQRCSGALAKCQSQCRRVGERREVDWVGSHPAWPADVHKHVCARMEEFGLARPARAELTIIVLIAAVGCRV